MHRGYVPVWRKLKDSTFYRDSEAVHLWLHILFEAQHTEKKEWYKGKEIVLQEGQFTTGRKRLASETGISESKIQRLLKKFEKCHMIEQQTNSANRLISIVNYKSHKASEQQTNNKRTIGEQQVNNVRTHSNNVNNVNNGEECNNTPQNKFDPKKYVDNIDWIDNDLWIEWIEHKKKLKLSVTERALKANVKKLQGFGKDKSEFNIIKALEKNWKDFYVENDLFSSPVKNNKRQLKHMDGHMEQIYMSESEVKKHKPHGAVNDRMICIDSQFYFNPFHEDNQ